MDNNASACGSGAVPDIFFKCLNGELDNSSSNEMKDNSEELDSFGNLMNMNGNGWYNDYTEDQGKMKNKLCQMDLIWQALMYCAKNEEWREDRSIVKDDVDVAASSSFEKQNVLPAIEV